MNNFKVMGGIIAEESVLIAGDKFQKENPNSKIRFMPDCHGSGDCIVGTTMTISDKVNPSHIGVDIGCGVLAITFKKKQINFKELDDFIKKNIPSGKEINQVAEICNLTWLDEVIDRLSLDASRVYRSIGTLGGGNHYIEIGESGDTYCLSIHTGSRGFGALVARHYIGLSNSKERYNEELRELIENTEPKLREKAIIEFKEKKNKEIGYLTGSLMDQYLKDQWICCIYAEINRQTIANKILDFLGVHKDEINYEISSMHNYINSRDHILRKGAISAHMYEHVVIPLNMRDGVVVGVGYGHVDWNYSAPHGSGRVSSRSEARNNITLDEFRNSMDGVYSSCVDNERIDESPMAYKNSQMIIDALSETVEVMNIFKTVYNFKGM